MPLECCRERPQRRGLCELGKQSGLGDNRFFPSDIGALLSADLSEHISHWAASAEAGALVSAISSCSTRRAAPQSRDFAANSMPASTVIARPATNSAAPL